MNIPIAIIMVSIISSYIGSYSHWSEPTWYTIYIYHLANLNKHSVITLICPHTCNNAYPHSHSYKHTIQLVGIIDETFNLTIRQSL